LEAEGLPTLVVATKIDKLNKNALEQNLLRLCVHARASRPHRARTLTTPDRPMPLLLTSRCVGCGASARSNEGLALPEGQPLILSSKNGTGRNELWRAITDTCTAPVQG
jgi:hypothetical protein